MAFFRCNKKKQTTNQSNRCRNEISKIGIELRTLTSVGNGGGSSPFESHLLHKAKCVFLCCVVIETKGRLKSKKIQYETCFIFVYSFSAAHEERIANTRSTFDSRNPFTWIQGETIVVQRKTKQKKNKNTYKSNAMRTLTLIYIKFSLKNKWIAFFGCFFFISHWCW